MSIDSELDDLRREVERLRGILPERVDVDPEGVEHGLGNLEALLSLGDDEEVERMGLALMRLEQKVHEMARSFGLDPADLNLGLGPLGRLV